MTATSTTLNPSALLSSTRLLTSSCSWSACSLSLRPFHSSTEDNLKAGASLSSVNFTLSHHRTDLYSTSKYTEFICARFGMEAIHRFLTVRMSLCKNRLAVFPYSSLISIK